MSTPNITPALSESVPSSLAIRSYPLLSARGERLHYNLILLLPAQGNTGHSIAATLHYGKYTFGLVGIVLVEFGTVLVQFVYNWSTVKF